MKKIIITKDKSHTLLDIKTNQHYHSIYGAINESKHVFIKNGILSLDKKKINILEVGLGTGLNALLTLKVAKEKNICVNYSAIEPYPLKIELIKKLNYCKMLKHEKTSFLKIHCSSFDKKIKISDKFILLKWKNKIQRIRFSSFFDLVYFDAFSPSVQKEMWSEEVFLKLFQSMKKKSTLVTYCCQGKVKRIMEKTGFFVRKIAGPPGKREMIVATREN